MALAQSIATPYGVNATYWTISKISIDRENLIAEIHLKGYADEKAEQEKKECLDRKYYQIKFVAPGEVIEGIKTEEISDEVLQVFGLMSQLGYNRVKKIEEFIWATDC